MEEVVRLLFGNSINSHSVWESFWTKPYDWIDKVYCVLRHALSAGSMDKPQLSRQCTTFNIYKRKSLHAQISHIWACGECDQCGHCLGSIDCGGWNVNKVHCLNGKTLTHPKPWILNAHLYVDLWFGWYFQWISMWNRCDNTSQIYGETFTLNFVIIFWKTYVLLYAALWWNCNE